MKKTIYLFFIVFLIAFLSQSCKKDSTNINNNNNISGPGKGNITVAVNYDNGSSVPNQTYYYSLTTPIRVDLYDSTSYNLLNTKYINSGTAGSVEFDNYSYGYYYVHASATEMRTSMSTGSSSTNLIYIHSPVVNLFQASTVASLGL